MDIQPPKRRPVVPQRPVRPAVASQPRPKISLDSVRQVRQSAQQQSHPVEQTRPDPVPEIPARSEPRPQFIPAEEQAPVRTRAQPAVQRYEPEPVAEHIPSETAPVAQPVHKIKKPKRQKQKHRLRTVLLSIFVLLVLGAAGTAGGLWYVRNQQPQYVGARFVSDLQSDDPSAAYGLVSGAFKAATSEATLATLFKKGAINYQGPYMVSDKILPTKASPTSATYVYKITNSGSARYVRVILQKNAKWQVNSFNASDSVLTAQVAN